MLEIFKRRYSQAVNNATELEEAKNKARTAEHRVKELEHQLSLQSEASSITVSFQNQLTKYRALEKENAKLKEDNQYYRQTNESNLLLKEETEHVKAKLSRAEQRLKDLIMLEVENEELKKKVQKYGVEDKFGSKRHSSPVGRVHEVSTIREVKTDDIEEILNELDKVKESDLRHQELAEGLQRHLFIVTADRDACRKILNQFDTKYSANCDPQLKHRLTETEMQLTSYEQHVEKQQVELQNAKEDLSTVRLKVKKLERALNGFKKTSPSQASESSPTLVTELKTQLEKLKKENGELAERLEVYELRKEQMHMQGYFDPLKTKVVHFSMNPSNLARQQRAEEIKRLQDENEALRQRVRLLEEGKASPGDQAAWKNLSPDAGDPSVMKQVQDVKAQLSSSELKNQRLKEVFSRKIQEFREACYALTGYKIDVVRDKKYRLQSMYAERANDDLLFESNSKGEMMMLQTDFSAQVADQIDTYLKKMNSIPAFLSAVTLDLFSRQTTTIVIN
ncbi:predicted protein [Nematostella vectensis]|uniref:Mitotic spindle assembly checkpoint protein MAD1 n=1 Tax=Nematostella vectensis TaxID=45351 RepID=A7S876_NEMVE|nr:predicted protein [Nematostella vectensis]|eukprot:XP_001632078.1 predicted protein [Nematostella vectensis]